MSILNAKRARPIITKWDEALSDRPSFAALCSRLHPLWLLGLLTALLVSLGQPSLREPLRYERVAILEGEYWRLLSGHFVHGTFQHLLLNIGGLFVIAALFARAYSLCGWVWVLLLSVAAIDAGFVLYEPQLEWYVGFSGVLHGAIAAGAIAWWKTESRLFAWGLSLFLIGKLVWEQYHGALPLAGELPVVVDAHLYGALGGAVAASIIWLSRQPWLLGPRSL